MKYLCGLFIFFKSCFLFAQHDTANTENSEIQKLLSIQSESPAAGLKFHLGAANSDVSFSSASPFLFQDHLNNRHKQNIMDGISGNIRVGYWQEISAFYDQPGYYSLEAYKPGNGFVLRNNSFTSVRGPSEVVALALYGNQPFENQMLTLDGSAYESWSYTSLGYRYHSVFDSIPFTAEVAFVLNHTYQKYKVNKAELYTAPHGEYIDALLNYELIDANNQSGAGINGLGFSAGFSTTLPLTANLELDLSVEDFGINFITNARNTRVDSSFRFRGGSFGSIFDINDSIFSNEIDRITNGLYNKSGDNYVTLMPFKLQFRLSRKLSHSFFKKIYVFSRYRRLVGYIPQSGVGSVQSWNNQSLSTEIYYGGFNSAGLAAEYSVRIFDRYHLSIGSRNVLAFIVPFASTGTSVHAALHYKF